jgi:hypothetical protein
MDSAPKTMWTPEEDPIVRMLLRAEATTVSEAESRYLDSHIPEIVELVQSSLSEEQFRSHPLIMMLFSHGSREWEDSLE